jgi:chromate reductase
MADKGLVVLGIAGSLRRASYNRGLLRAAVRLAPAGIEIRCFDLHGVPFYDGDVEAQGDPGAVRRLKEAIRGADALLIATPEYNGSYSGVLKNALDWASRPPQGSALRNKPVAMIGASPSCRGTARAQEALHRVLLETEARVLPGPRLLVAGAHLKFDSDGNLHDDETRAWLGELVETLAGWVQEPLLTHKLAG